MADTTLTSVANQIQEFWAPLVDKDLVESFVLPALVETPGSRASVPRMGNTVRVSQFDERVGENKTIGVDASTFTPEEVTLTHVDVEINRRAIFSTVFDDLVELQSQVSMSDPKLRQVAVRAMERQINSYLYSLSAPTVEQTSIAAGAFNAAKLTELGQIADDALWPEDERYLLVDATYWKALMDDAVLTSADFVQDRPVMRSAQMIERYGWKIIKDTSAAMKDQLNASGGGVAQAFNPNYLEFIIQQQARTKISDRHSNDEFKMGFSIDKVYGATLGLEGADKHIVVRTGA